MRACNLKDVQYVSSRCCVTFFLVILAGSVSSVNQMLIGGDLIEDLYSQVTQIYGSICVICG